MKKSRRTENPYFSDILKKDSRCFSSGAGRWRKKFSKLIRTRRQRCDLMGIIAERHHRRATLAASQLPTEYWHEYLGEPTLADAVLDRLLLNAHRLTLYWAEPMHFLALFACARSDYCRRMFAGSGITSVATATWRNIVLRLIMVATTAAATNRIVSCGAASGKAGLISCQWNKSGSKILPREALNNGVTITLIAAEPMKNGRNDHSPCGVPLK